MYLTGVDWSSTLGLQEPPLRMRQVLEEHCSLTQQRNVSIDKAYGGEREV